LRDFAASLFCLVALAASAARGDDARPSAKPPLFAAFQSFCIDTGAEPGAVQKAVEAAGGVPHHPFGGSTDAGTLPGAPFPMTLFIWDVVVQGHKLIVAASASYPTRDVRMAGRRGVFDFDTCTIDSFANDDAGAKAIRDWVGVPPLDESTNPHDDKLAPDVTQSHFEFQTVGSVHKAVTGLSERLSASAEGREWSLTLLHDPRSVGVQFMHALPKSPPAAH
jgi:hypothetical protein